MWVKIMNKTSKDTLTVPETAFYNSFIHKGYVLCDYNIKNEKLDIKPQSNTKNIVIDTEEKIVVDKKEQVVAKNKNETFSKNTKK